MKIVLGGSVSFAKEELAVKEELEKAGQSVYVSEDLLEYSEKPQIKMSFEEEVAISLKLDILRKFFDKIAEADAYLVCNYPKKGVDGYLGTSVLMEIGVAYHLKKKIYLMYDIDKNQNYAAEIAIIQPVILGGDLSKVAN